jgi:hypothetical protein
MAVKLLRSHALQQKVPLAAPTSGSALTMACVTTQPTTFTADTAVPTRTGTRRDVLPIYARMVSVPCTLHPNES